MTHRVLLVRLGGDGAVLRVKQRDRGVLEGLECYLRPHFHRRAVFSTDRPVWVHVFEDPGPSKRGLGPETPGGCPHHARELRSVCTSD